MDKFGVKEELAAERGGSPAVAEKLKWLEAPPVVSRPRETFSQFSHSVCSAGTAGTRWAEALFKLGGGPAVVQGKQARRAVRLEARQRGARIQVPAQHAHPGQTTPAGEFMRHEPTSTAQTVPYRLTRSHPATRRELREERILYS